MATVRISDALIGDVTKQIHAMRAAEISALQKKYAARDRYIHVSERTTPGITEFLERVLWGKHADLRGRLPEEWCVPFDDAIINIGDGDTRNCVLCWVKAEGQKLWAPPNTQRYSLRINVSSAHVAGSVLEAPVTKALEFNAATLACVDRFKTVEMQVVSFLRSQPSLNMATKAFPDVLLYIPTEYKERMEAASTRLPRKKMEEEAVKKVSELDRELLAAVAVGHALRGGGHGQ